MPGARRRAFAEVLAPRSSDWVEADGHDKVLRVGEWSQGRGAILFSMVAFTASLRFEAGLRSLDILSIGLICTGGGVATK